MLLSRPCTPSHPHTLHTHSSKRFVVPAEDKVALEAKEMVREWRDKLTDLYVVRGALQLGTLISWTNSRAASC